MAPRDRPSIGWQFTRFERRTKRLDPVRRHAAPQHQKSVIVETLSISRTERLDSWSAQ
jgi:hypothetical protein